MSARMSVQLIVHHLQTIDCAEVTTIAMQLVQWVCTNELVA